MRFQEIFFRANRNTFQWVLGLIYYVIVPIYWILQPPAQANRNIYIQMDLVKVLIFVPIY